MPRGRAKPPLVLTSEERETLERWARRPTSAQALARRARIVLRCAAGALNQAVRVPHHHIGTAADLAAAAAG